MSSDSPTVPIEAPPQRAILEYCKTPTQRRSVEAWLAEGTFRKAASRLGLAKSTVQEHVSRAKAEAALKGCTETMDLRAAVPSETHDLGKLTVHLKNGQIEQVWARANPNKESLRELAESLRDEMFRMVKPFRPIPKPKHKMTDRMTSYIVADQHLGMYAWADESGDSWDCDICSKVLIDGVQEQVSTAEPTRLAIIEQLGDFFHITDETNETPRGKNKLDVDGRWKRVSRIGIRLIKSVIDLALQKHAEVVFYNIRGNHDLYSAFLVGLALEEAYSLNPRVTIVNPEAEYAYHRFGNSLIGMGHGHLAKPNELGAIMMSDKRRDVGECDWCYWHTGHVHHESSKDHGWYKFDSFSTLTAKDAHAAGKYRAPRMLTRLTFDKEFGQKAKYTTSIQEIRKLKP